MRKIEFRGYSVEELVSKSQWINGGFGVHTVEYVDGKEECYLYTWNGAYEVNKDSVGQYTGLKDKKGKKIYEGDVVRFTDNRLVDEGMKRIFTGEVSFANGSFIIERKGVSKHYRWMDYEVEVIGNLYEQQKTN